MKHFQFCWGVVMATFAAGPIFAAAWIVMSLIFQGSGSPFNVLEIFSALFIAPVTALIGAPIAFLPNLIGGAVMATLGAVYPATRKRRIWATAGAAFGTMIWAALLGTETHVLPAYLLPALTGAICALIVRYGTRWSDEST